MKEFKKLSYVLVTCFLTMMTVEAQSTQPASLMSDPPQPTIYKEETTLHAEYPTKSKKSISPMNETPGHILSPTINSMQTTTSSSNLRYDFKITTEIITEKLPTDSVNSSEMQLTTTQLSTNAQNASSNLRSISPVMKNSTRKMQIEHQIVAEELTARATSKSTSEQPTTKSVKNTDFGMQSATTQGPTKAQKVMTNPPATTQVVPNAKLFRTTEIITEKLPNDSVTTKSANSSGMQLKTTTQLSTNAQNATTSPPNTTQDAKLLTTAKMSTEKTTMKIQSTTSAQKVMTEKTTTQLVPTAKLSATTQITTKTVAANDFGRQSATTRATTKVQKTTTKFVKTNCPPVITKLQTTTSTLYNKDDKERAVKHGKIVAGIIGGALLAMMVGFLVILYRKHKLQKHQIATTDWAGPTPFLETGSANSHVTLRSANRISLTSFLPQRLSKRLSLLAESTEEMQEMQEMVTPSTFAGKEEKKVKENGPKLNKTEKAEMCKLEKQEVDKTEKSANETTENKSEISSKTDDVIVVNEMDKNCEIKNKDGQNEKAKIEQEENKALENKPAENPPQDPNNKNKEETGKEGADNVV